MKTISKRLSAVLLSVYMVFGVVSTDYLTVQAFEWVVPSLTVGESLLWLMGLLGMTFTEGSVAWRDVSPEYEQDFIDYANEHGLTYTETSNWLNDTASGKLNQLSEVWTNFKEWVKSKFSSSGSVPSDLTCSNVFSPFVNELGDSSSVILDSVFLNDALIPSCGCIVRDSSGVLQSVRFYSNVEFSTSVTSNGTTITYNIKNVGSSGYLYILYNNGSSSNPWRFEKITISSLTYDSNYLRFSIYPTSTFRFSYFPFSSALDYSSYVNVPSDWAYYDSTSSDFDVYNPTLIPDINFAAANTEDSSIPGVIDLPWGNLGDDEEERDKTYDDLVGGLDLGQELGDLWQALQDLMGVLAVDDAGVLQPNSGGENPPTLEDEVENNKVNGAFVLTGLQKVFPFCIPFDLYAFITLLEELPVAPVIQYPIYNPVTDSNEIITIDFSTWESVVILFRYIFDFLFIIGLLLMARALIGGGDSA